ncbi:MAG: hypothetical protein NZ899_05140 [Thermoguttaceae bacterium]|nr:hypothetical protein [Thermoguttaceae bacterium]MDW8078299.1 hypothetical protein [Thermoguttaceae bacterium]
MNTLWYNLTVITTWLVAMGWLLTAKVLPTLRIGQPPSYQSILQSQREDPLVGWKVLCNEKDIGWALSLTKQLQDGMTRVDSLVYLERLPLEDLLPKWLQGLLLPAEVDPRRIRLEMEVRSEAMFDPLSRLTHFYSHVRFPPVAEGVRVLGKADEGKLHLTVRYGDLSQELEIPLPRHSLFGDTSSPVAKLPGLREGQRWTVQVYSPFASPNQPVEILEARVERLDQIAWGGRINPVWVVVYRSEPGKGASRAAVPRGRLWVRPDGTVLKQEAQVFDARLTFVRLRNEAAAQLAARFSELTARDK